MDKKRKKIGIMGGTFNPIHYGHLIVAEDARKYYNLDEIIFIPSGNSYMKDVSKIINGDLRLNMTKLAIQTNPYFSFSDIEINRKGHTYTYETLEALKKENQNADLYFILGADNLFSVEKWKYSERIMQNCTLIVAARGEVSESELKKQADYLSCKYHTEIVILPERKIDISSTEIRKNCQNGKSILYMTPTSVISYINENNLYQS